MRPQGGPQGENLGIFTSISANLETIIQGPARAACIVYLIDSTTSAHPKARTPHYIVYSEGFLP